MRQRSEAEPCGKGVRQNIRQSVPDVVCWEMATMWERGWVDVAEEEETEEEVETAGTSWWRREGCSLLMSTRSSATAAVCFRLSTSDFTLEICL